MAHIYENKAGNIASIAVKARYNIRFCDDNEQAYLKVLMDDILAGKDTYKLLFGETAIIATMMQSSFHRITTIFLSILAMKAGKVLSWIELKVKLNITKIQITIRVDRGSMATL